MYVGGVEFWARPRDATSPSALADAVLERLRSEFGEQRAWLHTGRRDIGVALPLTHVERALMGDDAPLKRIAAFVAMLRREGTAVSITVGTEISYPLGEPSIAVQRHLPATGRGGS